MPPAGGPGRRSGNRSPAPGTGAPPRKVGAEACWTGLLLNLLAFDGGPDGAGAAAYAEYATIHPLRERGLARTEVHLPSRRGGSRGPHRRGPTAGAGALVCEAA
jgi:hypothetical protein